MKRLAAWLCLPVILLAFCSINANAQKMGIIDKTTQNKVIKALASKAGASQAQRLERGVAQAAAFWMKEDGTPSDFEKFVEENFVADPDQLDALFKRLQDNYESIYGHFNKITLDLNKPLHLDMGENLPVDEVFGAYSPYAHLSDDFFKNKIAFMVLLNFPHYSLKEKTELGPKWTRKEWAYARMGDIYSSRVPGEFQQKVSDALTASGVYISKYNIYMGQLVNDQGKTMFPADLRLLSHWNLRDELKSQYAKPDGREHQRMIYQVMQRIVTQEIPKEVIDKKEYQWNPYSNKLFSGSKEVKPTPESTVRYQMLLDNFRAMRAVDPFSPMYPTFIDRKFEEEYEIPQPEVEALFTKFVSSPTVKKVAALISKRLGRPLKPWDIWYDGFKARSSISEDDLNKKTRERYPNTAAFKKDLPNILRTLGFKSDKADWLASRIEVDPARGSGHAWGAQMKSENAHLRTRIASTGMDYKGYNIAVHEFGHNVEQTITLNDMDYYMLNGVPNTAFTEAIAFVFQKRDLEILGMKEDNPNKMSLMALDNFWSAYEIMGVSLVDMAIWKWLYAHPNATAEELKAQTLVIAKEVWNKYFADVLGGEKDQPLLGIYSHMIENPLYLSAYPIGHLIEFGIEQYINGKDFAGELYRMLIQGRIIPQLWMKGAVGTSLSVDPSIKAAEEALAKIQ